MSPKQREGDSFKQITLWIREPIKQKLENGRPPEHD